MRNDKYSGMTFGEASAARAKDRAENAAKRNAFNSKAIVKTITAKLEEMFKDMDAEVLAKSITWAAERVKAIETFKDAEQAKPRAERLPSHKYYETLFMIAGGKTWYNVFNGRNEAMINEFVAKNCAAIAEKRNANITNKIVKAGVTEISETTYARTSDGFNGAFRFITDQGEKLCTINTIGAGGYNIQCYHLRVLVKVR